MHILHLKSSVEKKIYIHWKIYSKIIWLSCECYFTTVIAVAIPDAFCYNSTIIFIPYYTLSKLTLNAELFKHNALQLCQSRTTACFLICF